MFGSIQYNVIQGEDKNNRTRTTMNKRIGAATLHPKKGPMQGTSKRTRRKDKNNDGQENRRTQTRKQENTRTREEVQNCSQNGPHAREDKRIY